jgi:hypothetical protein
MQGVSNIEPVMSNATRHCPPAVVVFAVAMIAVSVPASLALMMIVSYSSTQGQRARARQSPEIGLERGPTGCEKIDNLFKTTHRRHQSSPDATTPRRTLMLSNSVADLYHHFVYTKFHTLIQGEQVLLDLFWLTAPSLATSRLYLMNYQLTLSGHHRLSLMMRSYLDLETESSLSSEVATLRLLVLEYQSCALRNFLMQLNAAVSTENCAAACLASILVLLSSFAHQQLTETHSATLDGFLNDPNFEASGGNWCCH